MKKSKIIFCYLFSVFILISLQAGNNAHAQQTDVSGRELFIEYRCSRCHTIGRGKFVGPDLANLKEKYTREEVVTWITGTNKIYEKMGKKPVNEGYPPMPPINVPDKHAERITEYLLEHRFEEQKQDRGTITGNVYNYSQERKSEDGVEVILKAYMGDRQMEERKTVTDSHGEFTFDKLPWNRSYEISVNYNKAEYTTDKMVFPPDESSIELELPVYEPTEKTENIVIQHYHIIMDVREDTMYTAEVIDIKNTGNRIYTGTRNESLDINNETMVITLPKNATNVDIVQGLSRNNLVLRDNSIHDTTAIAPGYRRITITYQLSLDGGAVSLKKKLHLRTESVLVLIGGMDGDVDVSGLEKGKPVTFRDQQYSRWQGGSFESGDVVSVSVSRPFLQNVLSEKMIPVAVFVILLLAGAVYNLFYRGRNSD